MTSRNACATALLVIISTFIPATWLRAQMVPMGVPYPTTMTLSKPAPDQTFGDKTVVTMGVGRQKYKFILVDAQVLDPTSRVMWPEVWQYVREHQPNFVVQGLEEQVFQNVQPGQTITVNGIFAPLDRTFEVQHYEIGQPTFEAPKPKSY